MPELPEVETVMRGLAPALAGATFKEVETRRRDLRFPLPANFAARLTGCRVEQLQRRAKYILAHLDSGFVLAMHLGMTGRFTVTNDGPGSKRAAGRFYHSAGGDAAHDHVVFRMSNGARVTFNDARRFGYMDLIAGPDIEQHKLFRGLGAEPLSNAFNAAYLAEAAFGRRTNLKSLLMDQRIVAGLGNIYVCEALHRARLKPSRPSATLADRRRRPTAATERLVDEIRRVLDEAIVAGGSSLRDYARTNGEPGMFQISHLVYDRDGEPCQRARCSGTIRRVVHSGRSTYYCSKCQR